jgi:hypothetical protein
MDHDTSSLTGISIAEEHQFNYFEDNFQCHFYQLSWPFFPPAQTFVSTMLP